MPNLRLISGLHKKYSGSDQLNKGFDLGNLNESFKYDKSQGISGFDDEFSHFDAESVSEIKSVFENRAKVDVVLMFIDMVDFSTRFESFENDGLSKILDSYYDLVIPIIYKYGGEVEKLIGDGIICVFGEPFITHCKHELLFLAEGCAKEVIERTFKENLTTKIALHSGEIMYYQPPTSDFNEFTIIGKPLTELFRLESVSMENSINYFIDSSYDFYISGKNIPIITPFTRNSYKWIVSHNPQNILLPGVHFRALGSIRYNSSFISGQ